MLTILTDRQADTENEQVPGYRRIMQICIRDYAITIPAVSRAATTVQDMTHNWYVSRLNVCFRKARGLKEEARIYQSVRINHVV